MSTLCMIITISGKPGTGKSSVAKRLAEKLHLKHYSTGDLMRQMTVERKMSLIQLSELAQKDPSIDRELDERQKKLGKTEDNFIIDARIAFHFIPQSIKIFCDANIDIAAQRVFKSKRNEEKLPSVEATKKELIKRIESEKGRYKKYYGVDYYDMKNYDLVIDTDGVTVEDMVKTVLDFLKEKRLIKTK